MPLYLFIYLGNLILINYENNLKFYINVNQVVKLLFIANLYPNSKYQHDILILLHYSKIMSSHSFDLFK